MPTFRTAWPSPFGLLLLALLCVVSGVPAAAGPTVDATTLGRTFGASHPNTAVPGRHAPGLVVLMRKHGLPYTMGAGETVDPNVVNKGWAGGGEGDEI